LRKVRRRRGGILRQLLGGGSLAKTIAAANEEFNATELFGELVRDATAFPAQPFLHFFKTRPREAIARVVIKALSFRGHLPPDLARAAGSWRAGPRNGKSASPATTPDRAGVPLPPALAAERDAMREDNSTKITFLKIPAGKFQMGSRFEQPIHEVTITQPFWMAMHPVTNQQYRLFLEANPSQPVPEHFEDTRFNGESATGGQRLLGGRATLLRSGRVPFGDGGAMGIRRRAGSRGQYCFGIPPGISGITRGLTRTAKTGPTTWGRNGPMPGASTTCMGMSGNGAKIGR